MTHPLQNVGTSALVRRILLAILAFSLIVGASGLYLVLRRRALETASKEAHLLLATATAVSGFTDDEVFHLLDKLPPDQFYRQVVPFYATTEVFHRLRRRFPYYVFRQPALNPTNPNDRPTPHEVELIDRFRDDGAATSLEGIREDDGRTFFYVAQPIRITSDSCLVCHSTPDRAPAAMVADYGRSNGFGWKKGDTVGLVELSVPITEQLRGTTELTATLAAALTAVFLTIYIALTAALRVAVVTPLRRLAEAADIASRAADGPIDLPHFGALELRQVSAAIGRLSISLRKAMRQLPGRSPKSPPRGRID